MSGDNDQNIIHILLIQRQMQTNDLTIHIMKHR